MSCLQTHFHQLYHTTEILSGVAHLSELFGNMTGTLKRLQDKLSKNKHRHAKSYQEMVIDYAAEWETVVSKMVEGGVSYSRKEHKTVQHYEDKVAKLRKQTNELEQNNKNTPTTLTEKLTRNECKLEKAWQEYDRIGTRTANLLEAATKMGWKDLHPLIQAMISFEQERERDEQSLWEHVDSIQDTLLGVVTRAEDEAEPSSGRALVPREEEDIIVEPTEHMEEFHRESSEEEEELRHVQEEPFGDERTELHVNAVVGAQGRNGFEESAIVD